MIVVSLFDATGVWSQPYADAGHDVTRVDLTSGDDVMQWTPPHRADVVLAAPPCTVFAGSGARWWNEKDDSGETRSGVRLVERTIHLINTMNPSIWALENPVGRLNDLVPSLRKWGPWYFEPFWYGDPYTKRTGLWGQFNYFMQRRVVYPSEGSRMHRIPPSDNRAAIRSATPPGFAAAFFEANS